MIVRACPLLQERKFKITGVAVIDVVEGQICTPLAVSTNLTLIATNPVEYTLEALPMMHSLLDTRPAGFDSPEEAIEWQYV